MEVKWELINKAAYWLEILHFAKRFPLIRGVGLHFAAHIRSPQDLRCMANLFDLLLLLLQRVGAEIDDQTMVDSGPRVMQSLLLMVDKL